MQTFLPFVSFEKSAHALDKRRCFKQAVEAKQILNTLCGVSEGWKHHPAVRMWEGYVEALKVYYNVMLYESITFNKYNTKMTYECVSDVIEYPKWLGDEQFHRSHINNLSRKALYDVEKGRPELYNRLKRLGIQPEQQDIAGEYIWPVQ